VFDFLGRARSFVEKETQTLHAVFGVVLTISFTVAPSVNKCLQKVGFIRIAFDIKKFQDMTK